MRTFRIKITRLPRNAAHFKHEEGGAVKQYALGGVNKGMNSFITQDPNSPLTNDPLTFNPNIDYSNSSFGLGANQGLNTNPDGSSKLGTGANVPLNAATTPAATPNNFDWGKAGYLTSAFASPAFHLINGLRTPETLDHNEYQNPYDASSRSLMSNRSINMKPIRDDIRMQRQAGLNAARNAGTSSGQFLSNANQIGANTQQALATARMNEQQANNAYRGEEASNLNQLGSERARTKLAIKDINDRNQAARYKNLEAAAYETGKLGQGMYGDNMRLDNINNFLEDFEYDPKTRKFNFKKQ